MYDELVKKVNPIQTNNNCFNDISVNANLISVRLKSKRQRINTITFYLRDISTPLVVSFSNIEIKYKNC